VEKAGVGVSNRGFDGNKGVDGVCDNIKAKQLFNIGFSLLP